MSDNDERDAYGEATFPQDPLGSFDAFRARRAEEQRADETFPTQYGDAAYAGMPPAGQAAAVARGRLRSMVVFGGAAALVVGLGAGIYAATQSSGEQSPAASPAVTSSVTPSAGASKAAKSGRAVTAQLTVTAVGTDSFNATTASGMTVSVHFTSDTRFGTAVGPFTRSQLVPGAVVYARLRREADGTVVAVVIASAPVAKGDATAGASSASTGA